MATRSWYGTSPEWWDRSVATFQFMREEPDQVRVRFSRGGVFMTRSGQLLAVYSVNQEPGRMLPPEDVVQRRIDDAARDLTGLPVTVIRRRDAGDSIYVTVASVVEGVRADLSFQIELDKKTGMVLSCYLRNCVPGPPNATKPVMSADQVVAIGIKAVQERYKPGPLTMVFGPDLRITNMTYIKRSELAAHRELTVRERQHLEAGGSLLVYYLTFAADDKAKTLYSLRVSAVTGKVLTLSEYPPR